MLTAQQLKEQEQMTYAERPQAKRINDRQYAFYRAWLGSLPDFVRVKLTQDDLARVRERYMRKGRRR